MTSFEKMRGKGFVTTFVKSCARNHDWSRKTGIENDKNMCNLIMDEPSTVVKLYQFIKV
jgi:hypothetical protein